MNGIKRMGLLVGLLLAAMGLFSNVAFAESGSGNDSTVVAASFDQKYLLPDYIAYSGIEAVAQRALTLRAAAAFDVNFLTPGSIVHTVGPEFERVQAARWQAIADYYAEQNTAQIFAADAARWQATADHYAGTLLTVDFDYAEAEQVQAARWQAMADYYAEHGLLTDDFDYAAAQEVQAARWQAMADYYAAHGLLLIENDALTEAISSPDTQ